MNKKKTKIGDTNVRKEMNNTKTGQINYSTISQLYDMMARDSKEDDTYHESLEKHISKIKDSYTNSVLGIGNADHLEQFSDYTFENTSLNWFLWLALYNESWVFRRVIDKPSQDMIRPGISLKGTEDFSKVYQALDLLKPDLINALKWSKLFGGSVMVLLFKGISFEDMESPIYDKWSKIENTKYVKSYVTDRWFGCNPSIDDIVSNLSNDDFGLPKYYDIQFADGTTHKIHHSWVLRFENRGAPNLIKTGMLQGWGYAEGQHIFHELSRDEKLKNSIQSLVDKSLIEVIQMPGMTGIFMGAESGNKKLLEARLNMVNWGRNFNSLTFLDKDDVYQQHTFSGVNGLADLLEINMRQIAAAVEMPNVLFGDLSNGFTSDDQALERYDEKIQNDNETYLRKPLTKLIKILYKIYGIGSKSYAFSFNSIIAEKKNQKRLDDINSLIDTCKKLVDEGVMSTDDEAKTIMEFINTDSVNFQFTNKNKYALEKANEERKETGSLSGDDDFDYGSMSLGSNNLKKANAGEKTNENHEPSEMENTANEKLSELNGKQEENEREKITEKNT